MKLIINYYIIISMESDERDFEKRINNIIENVTCCILKLCEIKEDSK